MKTKRATATATATAASLQIIKNLPGKCRNPSNAIHSTISKVYLQRDRRPNHQPRYPRDEQQHEMKSEITRQKYSHNERIQTPGDSVENSIGRKDSYVGGMQVSDKHLDDSFREFREQILFRGAPQTPVMPGTIPEESHTRRNRHRSPQLPPSNPSSTLPSSQNINDALMETDKTFLNTYPNELPMHASQSTNNPAHYHHMHSQKPERYYVPGLAAHDLSKRNVSSPNNAMCQGAKSIHLRLIHIQGRGMSLVCTFNANKIAQKGMVWGDRRVRND